MFRLIRAFDRHVEVISLRLGQLGQHHTDFFQVQAGDFLIQFLGGLGLAASLVALAT